MAANPKTQDIEIEAPVVQTQGTVKNFLGNVYRYDKIAAEVHGNRSETYDCGAQDSPFKVQIWDVQTQDGVTLTDVGQKRDRFIERSMSRRTRLRAMAEVVGKKLECSDPNCRRHVKTDEVDAEGKAVWVVDGPTTSNDCWHVTAVYVMQRQFEEFLKQYLFNQNAAEVEESLAA
jgi:hypothetical protein